jgi:hypothetical protein
VRIELTAGPDAGRHVELAAGTHLLGRAPHCDLRIDDPALEAHHLLIDVSEDGVVGVTQLAGRAPVVLDGLCYDGRATVGRIVEIGESRLELVTEAPVEDVPAPPPPVALVDCADPVQALCDAARIRRAVYMRRSRDAVSLGVGTVRLPIELVDGEVANALPLELHALSARAEWHDGLPVLLDADRHTVIGLVDDFPGQPRARAIARSITHQGANEVHLVIGGPGDPDLEACDGLLEVGARWRARWTPDVDRPVDFVRLHAAGRAGQSGCSSPSR